MPTENGAYGGVAFIAPDEFGRRVAAILADGLRVGEVHGRLRPQEMTRVAIAHRLVVLGLSRPSPAFCEQWESRAAEHDTPWLPVIMDGLRLRAGPLILPRQAPCFRCFQQRQAQHDPKYAITKRVLEFHETQPAAPLVGSLPHHARMASAFARLLIEDHFAERPTGRSYSGQVLTMDLQTNRVAMSGVVAYGDCDRCGSGWGAPRPERLKETVVNCLGR